MHVITRKALKDFWERHPDAERPLREWLHAMEQGAFPDFTSVRAVWASADYVDGLTVFNIGGNKYRLVVDIRYNLGRVYIQQVLAHAEYDRGLWKRSK